MKKNIFLIALSSAALLFAVSCGSAADPTYRVDGATPQERYSVTLTPDSTAAATPYVKGKKVKHLVMPPKSRSFIAHDLLARTVSPLRIACGDTIYRFLNDDEVYTYSVTYDRKCVPDYKVLLRDLQVYGGVKLDTSTDNYTFMLRIADTAAYRAAIAPFLRSSGVNIRFDSEGHWMYYTPMPEGDTRHPMHIFEIVSALRYYWCIDVVPDPSLDLLELMTTGPDFATPGLDEEQVSEMLMRKFGMELEFIGRDITIVCNAWEGGK